MLQSFVTTVGPGNSGILFFPLQSPAIQEHCRDDGEVKTWHLSPYMSPLSPAPWGQGLQMTGA